MDSEKEGGRKGRTGERESERLSFSANFWIILNRRFRLYKITENNINIIIKNKNNEKKDKNNNNNNGANKMSNWPIAAA